MSIWFEDHANPHAMVNLNEEFLFFSGKHRKKHATFFIDFYILCMRMITCEKKNKRDFRRATFEHYANISCALSLNPGRLDLNSDISHISFSSRIKTPLGRYMKCKTSI